MDHSWDPLGSHAWTRQLNQKKKRDFHQEWSMDLGLLFLIGCKAILTLQRDCQDCPFPIVFKYAKKNCEFPLSLKLLRPWHTRGFLSTQWYCLVSVSSEQFNLFTNATFVSTVPCCHPNSTFSLLWRFRCWAFLFFSADPLLFESQQVLCL